MIIFLDFDGVLHPERETDPVFFSNREFLWDLLRKAPKALVVFSTTWRRDRSTRELALMVCRDGGEDLLERFAGSTPHIDEDGPGWRERECRAWLAENCPGEEWIAIDDQAEWFSSGSRVVAVNADVGLTAEAVDEALRKIRESRF